MSTIGSGAPKAFVLISFEDEYASVYEELIKKPLEEAGYVVHRADSELNQQNILADIVRGIAAADLIVADLSGLNPNVFYELGIAHALEIPTILITQNIEELPFDLRAYRANEYSTHFSDAPRLAETIRRIGEERKANSIGFGSPVTDFLPRDLRPRGSPGHAGVIAAAEEEEASTEAEAEKGLLDYYLQMEEASDRFTSSMDRVTEATDLVGSKVEAHTQEFERLNLRPGPNTLKMANVEAMRAASDLNAFADEISAVLPDIETSVAEISEAMNGYLDWLATLPPAALAETDVKDFRQTAEELLPTLRDSLHSTRAFRDSVSGLRGFSRHINSASGRVVTALGRFISIIESLEAQVIRALSVTATLDATSQTWRGPTTKLPSDDLD